MNRNIEFRPHLWHWKMVLPMVTSYVAFTFIFNWFYEVDFQLWPFLVTVTSMVAVCSVLALFKKSHLSVVGNDVFLHGLKAELMVKKDMFGHQYIQITSNTETGYHQVKVTQNQFSFPDWALLLGKCNQK